MVEKAMFCKTVFDVTFNLIQPHYKCRIDRKKSVVVYEMTVNYHLLC